MTSPACKFAAVAAVAALFLAGCAAGEERDAPEPEPTVTTEEASPVAKDSASDAEVDAFATVDPEDAAALEEAQELLGEVGYSPGADPATCDAVFGPGGDTVLTMFTESQSLTDTTEVLAFVERTVGRIEEIAATAPTEVAGHLETLAGALALSATFEGRSQLDTVMTDTETSMTGIGEYCFGA